MNNSQLNRIENSLEVLLSGLKLRRQLDRIEEKLNKIIEMYDEDILIEDISKISDELEVSVNRLQKDIKDAIDSTRPNS